MAIYHLSVKTISRSAGRSATAAAAYRSGTKIHCQREDKTFDYTHKGGVENREIFTPEYVPEWATDREKLWNTVELTETRKNSTVAREFEVALPAELDPYQRSQLVRGFVKEIITRHQCVVDVAIHAPSREGDDRNYHAHILMSTRRIDHTGFTEKTRELDEKKSGEVLYWREQWANHCNYALERAGYRERIDHRSLDAQGIDREPTIHLGVSATALERRNHSSHLGDENRETVARNQARLDRPLSLDHEIIATEKLLAELESEHKTAIVEATAQQELDDHAKAMAFLEDGADDLMARWDAELEQEQRAQQSEKVEKVREAERKKEQTQKREREQNHDRGEGRLGFVRNSAKCSITD
ncbi:MAG: MobA/MobL family protein [Gammaproteobacteria bacterium]|nr:MobA/MobL family protein [Gammaproteobacteria bacterium]